MDQNKNKPTSLNFNFHDDRLRSLGELSASILHEISQPVTSIRMCSELSIRKIKKNNLKDIDYLQTNLQEIINLTKKVEEIIYRLQNFVRKNNTHDFPKVDLNQTIREAKGILNHQFLNENIKIITNLKNIPQINAHEVWLNQIVINLLKNAFHALSNKSPKLLKLKKKEVIISTQYIDTKKEVIMIVKDNAGGISNDLKEKIFEPFFTTKDKDGNGLGLSIIKLIIESLNGKIDLDVKFGEYSAFKIYIPASL